MSSLSSAHTRLRPGARLLLRVDHLLSAIERISLTAACALTVLIMLLVSVDAIARYLIGTPISFTFDVVTAYLMPATLFFALSFTLRHGGHVNVDLIVEHMPPRQHYFLIGLMLMIAFPIVFLIATQGASKTWHSWLAGDVTTGVYAWRIWMSEIIVPIGFGVLSARVAHVAVANLYAAITGEHAVAIPMSPSRNVPPEDAI